MARPRRAGQTEKAVATGTVQARRKLERERERAARTLSANIRAETLEAQKATAKRISSKPEDSRTLATPDPNAGIL